MKIATPTTRRLRAMVALTAVLGLAAAACGGDDSSGDSDTTVAGDTATTVAGDTATTVAAAVAAAGGDEGTFAKDEDTIVFGVVPDTESTNDNWKPLADYLGIVTGKKIEQFEATDYAALIEAVIADQVDIAALSGFTYYTADKNGADITPFAGQLTGELTEPGYYSVAVAKADSPIAALTDFAGKNICFVSETSTSGRLFPSKALKDEGIDPTTGVTPIFAGSHDASAQGVVDGTCDAGFAEDAVADPLIASGDLKEIDRQLVPGAPIVYQNVLPKSLIDTVVAGLADVTFDDMIAAGVKLDAGTTQEQAKEWFAGTKPVDDAYYDQIRDLCTDLPEVEVCAS